MSMLLHGMWVPNDEPSASYLLVHKDGYQRDRLEVAANECKQKRLVLDVGAHIGLWSIPLSKHFVRVEAFEPVAANFECLQKNLQSRNITNVMTHFCAVSNVNGQAALHNPRARQSSMAWMVVPGEGVECRTIDSFDFKDVDLIKLDVEGHEYEVIKGAKNTIARYKPVIILEEKFDPTKRASRLLGKLGMKCVWRNKADNLFRWK